ncbi:hypothetical protein BJY01DRAFT_221438 [Aspergillus pseudoustus]|uniref:BZIP domain-containing protein n=1 Tax=Aspergillus pseudoustus TaxID=1810923 RepID=A0ABR4JA55_9EURO
MNKLKGFTNRWSLKDDDSEGSVSQSVKRKEQLRRAQQNYRLRKEGYIKSLETEVVTLRTTRTDLQGETRRLSAEISWLRHIIEENHIILPPVPQEILALGSRQSSPASATATVGVDRDHLNNRRLIVQDGVPSLSASPRSLVESGPDRTPSPLRNQGDVVVAMNFILSLEGPCLDHVRSALKSPDPSAGHGHALTLTASVFRLYPDSGHSQEQEQLLNVSRTTLDRLLELSAQLPTEDELTPIQVWAFLCQNAAVAQAQAERVMAVAERLLDHIKCYGYGAVIPRAVVMEALRAF